MWQSSAQASEPKTKSPKPHNVHPASCILHPASPIGVFDSGLGGLSVLAEIARQLPHEDLLYFADSANCPYGPRPAEEIQRLSRAVVEFLLGQGAKLIVVACNTASAAALTILRQTFSAPVVGMVPAVKPAARMTARKVVGVLATGAAVQGQLFAEVVERFAADIEVLPQVCPGLVEQVEAGEINGPETEMFLRRCLEPLLERGADTLVLGCTHYPFLIPALRRIVGAEVTILDPSPAVARHVGRVLAERGLLNPKAEPGRRIYFTSGDPAAFATLLEKLTGERGKVEGVKWIRDLASC
jgi:glutamate racemase